MNKADLTPDKAAELLEAIITPAERYGEPFPICPRDAMRVLLDGYHRNELYKDTIVQKFYDLEQQQDKFMKEYPKHEELHRTKRNTYIDAGFWAKRLWSVQKPSGEVEES